MHSPRVYRVSPDDDINQLLRIIKESHGEHVVFVLPPKASLLRHEVNLRLLSSYAQESAAEVAIVTDDPTTTRRAMRYGIPIYESPESPIQSRSESTRETAAGDDSQTPEPRVTGPWTRRIAVLVVVFGALIGLSLTLSPKVEIAIVPATHPMQYTTVISMRDQLAPLLREEQVEVATHIATATTGRTHIGVTPAHGVLVLFNAGEGSVVVPAGTEAATQSGQIFVTTQDVRVPGREVTFFLDVPVGVQSGRAEVRATAAQPGTEGNVGADRIRVLRGNWPEITVRNLEPFAGGTDATLSSVSASDVERASSQAGQELDQAIRDRLSEMVAQFPHLKLVYSSYDKAGVSVEQAVGEISEQVEARARTTVRSYWVDTHDFYEIIQQGIPERVPIGYTWERAMGFDLDIEGYDSEQRELTFKVDVPLRPVIDHVGLAQAVAGMPVAEAIAHLRQEASITHAQVKPDGIEQLPSWAPWIRIAVELDLGELN